MWFSSEYSHSCRHELAQVTLLWISLLSARRRSSGRHGHPGTDRDYQNRTKRRQDHGQELCSRNHPDCGIQPGCLAGLVPGYARDAQHRSSIGYEVLFALFSRQKGRWLKTFTMPEPSNCVTLARDVLLACGYPVPVDAYIPSDLLEVLK